MVLGVLLFLLTGVSFASTSSDALAAFNRKDYATAFQLWERCAKSGDAGCQYDVGIMYIEGEGRPVDVKSGIEWFSKSAGQGNVKAQNRLGRLYLNGKVVTQDYARAMEYFMAAARQGYAAGQANIGLMYWRGYGVPVDLVEAFAWSELSTQNLASGARQRDDILKELSPDQWTKARDRAKALGKQYVVSKIPWTQIFEGVSGVVSILTAVLILWSFARSKKKRVRTATHEM